MICIGKYSFIVFVLIKNIFLDFLNEHMVFGGEISLSLFFNVELYFFSSFNMAKDCFIAIAMVQAIKINKKRNYEASLNEKVVEEKE